jgi:hypothetical protein
MRSLSLSTLSQYPDNNDLDSRACMLFLSMGIGIKESPAVTDLSTGRKDIRIQLLLARELPVLICCLPKVPFFSRKSS